MPTQIGVFIHSDKLYKECNLYKNCGVWVLFEIIRDIDDRSSFRPIIPFPFITVLECFYVNSLKTLIFSSLFLYYNYLKRICYAQTGV